MMMKMTLMMKTTGEMIIQMKIKACQTHHRKEDFMKTMALILMKDTEDTRLMTICQGMMTIKKENLRDGIIWKSGSFNTVGVKKKNYFRILTRMKDPPGRTKNFKGVEEVVNFQKDNRV